MTIEPPLVQVEASAKFQRNLRLLNITIAHLSVVATLPLHHRDPFNR